MARGGVREEVPVRRARCEEVWMMRYEGGRFGGRFTEVLEG